MVVLLILVATTTMGFGDDTPKKVGKKLSNDKKAVLLKQLENMHDRVASFQADFREIRKFAVMKNHIEYRGTLYYEKDKLLFLDYHYPVRSIMRIQKGTVLHHVDESPVADLMDISSADRVTGSTDIFSWNPTTFQGDIRETEKCYHLTPELAKEGVPTVEIKIAKDTLIMKHIVIKSPRSDQTDIFLSGVQMNEGIPTEVESFSLPVGTKINKIRQP